jgi:hypothetical protein
MEVRFTHPRNSDTYLADVSPLLTAKEALRVLLSPDTGPFLPALQPGEDDKLILRRTNKVIPPDMTMGSAGVNDGDVMDVMRGGQGARRFAHKRRTRETSK